MDNNFGITKPVTVNAEFSEEQIKDLIAAYGTVLMTQAYKGAFPKPETAESYRAVAIAFGDEALTAMNYFLGEVNRIKETLESIMYINNGELQ